MKNTPPALRAVYIILVPIVLLIILLNSGYLQRYLPAATVHGKTYKVVDYNYYYFDYYNTFLNDNESKLADIGYDPELEDSKQQYNAEMTWKDYFKQQAESNMAMTAYYNDLAEQAGYQFSGKELAPIVEKLAENELFYTTHNLSAKNYYISYYGSGVTEEIYRNHLTEQVKAQAYKEYLIRNMEPEAKLLENWMAEHPDMDYHAVSIRVITLDALPDRETKEIGKDQIDALQSKLNELVARYENGVSFDELQSAFSTGELGDEAGELKNATALDMPNLLSDWCLKDQSVVSVGDTVSVIDTEKGIAYFAILDGYGASGPELDAIAELNEEALAEKEESAMNEYSVVYSTIGMLLATG